MDWLSTITGIITGFGLASLIMLFIWKRRKKARLYDERYKKVHMKARTASWIVFLALSYVLTIVALLTEGLQLAASLLASLYVIGLITYSVATVIYNKTI